MAAFERMHDIDWTRWSESGARIRAEPCRTALNGVEVHPPQRAQSLFSQVSAFGGPGWWSRSRRFTSCRPDGRNGLAAQCSAEARPRPSVVENHAAPQRTYDDRTALDVDAVRRRADPEGVFRGDVDPIRDQGHHIGPPLTRRPGRHIREAVRTVDRRQRAAATTAADTTETTTGRASRISHRPTSGPTSARSPSVSRLAA